MKKTLSGLSLLSITTVLSSFSVLAMEPADIPANVMVFSSRDDVGLFSEHKDYLLYGNLLKEIIKEGTEDSEYSYFIRGFGYGINTHGLENYEDISDNKIFLAKWFEHEDKSPEITTYLSGVWNVIGFLNEKRFVVAIDPEW